jgi:5-methylcytosine-specific restriction protein A
MPTMPPMFRAHGARSKAEANREVDRRRGSAKERGYDSRWTKARASHLLRSPICRYCEVGAFGPKRVTAATVVDHLYPHRGERRLFWLTALWVSACEACHSGPKQSAERGGPAAMDALADVLGLPRLAALLAAKGPAAPPGKTLGLRA